MRILAIDFGEKRIGLAISDREARFALPLETLTRTTDREAIRRLVDLCRREGVDRIVVGHPRGRYGVAGEAAERAAGFAAKLARESNLPYELIDETLTSVEAERRLRDAGLDPRRHRGRVDAIAAQILLEEALGRQGAE